MTWQKITKYLRSFPPTLLIAAVFGRIVTQPAAAQSPASPKSFFVKINYRAGQVGVLFQQIRPPAVPLLEHRSTGSVFGQNLMKLLSVTGSALLAPFQAFRRWLGADNPPMSIVFSVA